MGQVEMGFAAKETHAAQAARILVIDGEASLCELLRLSFSRAGHSVMAATTAKAALQLLQTQRFELIVLDLLLPDMEGFDLLARLRYDSNTPIMVLSALTGSDTIARALDMGADGYVCKPIIFAEVEAKVRALLRRVYHFNHNKRGQQNRRDRCANYLLGDLRLDYDQRTLTIGGRTVRLSINESRLLRYLLEHPNQVARKEDLLRQVWGHMTTGPGNVVELAIGRLRRKLEDDPGNPRRLITVRSLGYRLLAMPAGPSLERHTRPAQGGYTGDRTGPLLHNSVNWLSAV